MLFSDDVDQYALHVDNKDDDDVNDLRFHLVCCEDDDVKRHCRATLKKIRVLQQKNYSREMVMPYKHALLEILVELRVRQYEVDFEGNIYFSTIFNPVPSFFAHARNRQVLRLRGMKTVVRQDLCSRSLGRAMRGASQNSKAG